MYDNDLFVVSASLSLLKKQVQDCTTEAIERLEDCKRYMPECLQFSCDMPEI